MSDQQARLIPRPFWALRWLFRKLMEARVWGFQWFVAWRYLMARPRRLSPGIFAVTAFALWVLIAAGVTAILHPFTDSLYVGKLPAPQWLTAAIGAVFALIPTLLISTAFRLSVFADTPLPRWPLVGSAPWIGVLLLIIGAIAQVLHWQVNYVGIGFDGPMVMRAGAALIGLWVVLLPVVFAKRVPRATWAVLLYAAVATMALFGVGNWFRNEPTHPPMWLVIAGLVALGQFPITTAALLSKRQWWTGSHEGVFAAMSMSRGLWVVAAVVVAVMKLLAGGTRIRPTRLLFTALNCFVGVAVVVLAAYAARHVIAPRIAAEMPWQLATVVMALGVLGVAALIAGLVRRAQDKPDEGQTAFSAACLVLAVVCIALYLIVQIQGEAVAALQRFGEIQVFRFPMWLIITSGIAGALIPLTLILAAIRYMFTFFTTVSIGGVAIGSMALVIVLSVMSGFETDLRDKILGSNAHMLLSKEDESKFSEYREVAEKLATVDGVVAQTPYLLSEVVIAANNNYANVIIKGVDPMTVGAVTDLDVNVDQPDGLERLYPLADDGGVLGPPADAGPEEAGETPDAGTESGDGGVIDPAPVDFSGDGDDDPLDFSEGEGAGAGDDLAALLEPPDIVDKAPDDFVDTDADADPLDFSGDDGPDADDDVPDPLDDMDIPIDEGPIAFIDELDGDDPFTTHITPRVARLPGVLAGRELVKQINLYEGQEVKLISPLGENTPAGPVPRTKPFRVGGSFFTGMYEYDLKFIYVELSILQDFLDVGDEVKGIEIRVKDPEQTAGIMNEIRSKLGSDYRVQDWKDLNRSLFSALKLEKIAMFLVLAIIILVASFSIVGNLIMIVIEKSKEIAVLKTLGASNRGVMSIFVVQGFFIGLVGTVVGVILGLVVCWLNIEYGVPLDPDVYYIDRLPMHVEAMSVALVAFAGVVISVIATIYPALIAARLEVVEGLRYE